MARRGLAPGFPVRSLTRLPAEGMVDAWPVIAAGGENWWQKGTARSVPGQRTV